MFDVAASKREKGSKKVPSIRCLTVVTEIIMKLCRISRSFQAVVPNMATVQTYFNDLSESLDDKLIVSSTPQRSNALTNKLSGVLSASYADSEIRDALQSLDEKRIRNSAETRRKLRLDVQKEVIQRNGAVVQEFGHVAEVRPINASGCFG